MNSLPSSSSQVPSEYNEAFSTIYKDMQKEDPKVTEILQHYHCGEGIFGGWFSSLYSFKEHILVVFGVSDWDKLKDRIVNKFLNNHPAYTQQEKVRSAANKFLQENVQHISIHPKWVNDMFKTITVPKPSEPDAIVTKKAIPETSALRIGNFLDYLESNETPTRYDLAFDEQFPENTTKESLEKVTTLFAETPRSLPSDGITRSHVRGALKAALSELRENDTPLLPFDKKEISTIARGDSIEIRALISSLPKENQKTLQSLLNFLNKTMQNSYEKENSIFKGREMPKELKSQMETAHLSMEANHIARRFANILFPKEVGMLGQEKALEKLILLSPQLFK